jgi:hypothetical protein
LILAHAGLFLVAWVALGFVKVLHGTPAIIYALMLSTSATPVFGLAVLEPILGHTSAGTKGFTLSLAKQVWRGKMDTVIKTVERNVRLV